MKYSLLILSVLLIVASCQELDVPPSKEDMLRATNWQLDTAYKREILKRDDDQNIANVDRVVPIPKEECAKDDVLKFRENDLGAHLTGENRCSINETAELQFRWGISADGSQMYIYDAKEYFGTDVNADILEFYEEEFTIRFSEYMDKAVSLDGQPTRWVRDTTIYTMQFKPAP